MTWEPYVLLFLDPVLYIVLQFFNNLKHIILRADNMKKAHQDKPQPGGIT